eukprot:CAMPEP_0114695682 /NCGR_PEP_ID=MMETSP0191-20121206/71658_1 /TAXON_ID=126664 /ORGANISM="Sorites sp." /LENGTH=463 /DNA_ID=CAMNT_0001992281 /DNA_START=6 /DNA_END=1394 /DNA_ORIENTATION=+
MSHRSEVTNFSIAASTFTTFTGAALAWVTPQVSTTPQLRGKYPSSSSAARSANSQGSNAHGSSTRLLVASAGAAVLTKGFLARRHGACGKQSQRSSGRLARGNSATKTRTAEAVVANGTSTTGLGANPATSWPKGKPSYTTEYPEEYDLADPKASFEKVGRMILKEMVGELPGLYELPPKEVSWVERSLEYNTQGGKMNRGLIVVETGVALMKHQGREPSNADLHRFAVLGWAVTRRGNPCWYRLPEVGLLNTNDFLMVEMYVYKIVKRHFGQEEIFPWLIDLLLETTFQTECGQLLDSICANCELEELTTERWTLIVKYKTAFYSFYLPVALAMLVTGCRDRTAFDTAREALLEMGIYFQAQDDYLDAFASPEVLGKVGTDIQDKKCSWLFAHAYHEQSTPEAKSYLDKHYGACEVGSEEEEKIKEIYKELGLQELFAKYEADIQDKLQDFKAKVKDADLPW